jgi:hypothetical protein
MAALTISNMANVVKRLQGDRLYEGIARQVPLFGLAKKFTNFGGSMYEHVVQYGVGGGQSATFANAQANKSDIATAKFQITRAKQYALASIDMEALLATEGNEFAVTSLLKMGIDTANLSIARSYGAHAYRGGGYLAQMSGISGSGPYTITLSIASEAALFSPGMKIVADTATNGSGTRRANALLVTGVSVSAGTLTVTGTTTGWAASDYIARDGDFGAVISGLGDWNPVSAPSSTTFYNVDRTSAVEFLSGSRKAYTGSIGNSLMDLCSLVGLVNGRPDIALLNPIDVATFAKEIGSAERITVPANLPGSKAGSVGYDAIAVFAPTGKLNVIGDPNCPQGRFHVGRAETIQFRTLGPAVRPVGELINGGRVLEYNADALEIRYGSYGNMMLSEPWHWGVGTLS